MLKKEPSICVIGAGPCGLTTLKNLLEQGFKNIVVFEQNIQFGGNWVYDEKNTHSSVYETTHLISSKRLSCFEDFPMPDDYPDYPSHQQVLRYFQMYAEHFALEPYISLNTVVFSVKNNDSRTWTVQYQDSSGQHTREFDYVFVANGHHWSPYTPHYPGDFQGELLHAHAYKHAQPFKDKTVLVVGAGNSACDIAVEIARVAKSTTLSTRKGQHIFPKFMFGKPTDVLFSKITWLPFRIQQYLAKWVIRLIQGRYAKYHLPTPNHKALSTHPTINSELLYALRHGKISTQGQIKRFSGNTVQFSDLKEATFDTIIFATGYSIKFPFFDSTFINYEQTQSVPLYLKMMPAEWDSLFFIGLFQPQGCIWPLADHQAKIAAHIIAGKLKRPTQIRTKIQKENTQNKRCFDDSPRHVLEVDYHRFRKQLLHIMRKHALV